MAMRNRIRIGRDYGNPSLEDDPGGILPEGISRPAVPDYCAVFFDAGVFHIRGCGFPPPKIL